MSAISTGPARTEEAIRGRVNVRAGVIVDGKIQKGTRSFNMEDMTADEAFDYLIEQDTLACALSALAEEHGVSTDEVLSAAASTLSE